jgi:8-oxo-dGTP pyrophosphatase MutT (NUDIX family)
VPVVGTDAHLPRLAHEALTPAAVRRQCASLMGFVPERLGDGLRFVDTPEEPVPAAVLVPLVQRGATLDSLQVLLTQRAGHLRDHAGQISFPGGRAEPQDRSLEATALREAHEEIGLDMQQVELLGKLPTYTTVTRYAVTPVVALVTPPLVLKTDAQEVAEAFEVPLSFLMDPAHHRHHEWVHDGSTRRFLSMPWQDPETQQERFIWGATAAMLRNLYRLLARA